MFFTSSASHPTFGTTVSRAPSVGHNGHSSRESSPFLPSPTPIPFFVYILDDSIATSRFNRRSFLRTTRYDDDDPVELEATAEAGNRRLRLTVRHSCRSADSCVSEAEEGLHTICKKYSLTNRQLILFLSRVQTVLILDCSSNPWPLLYSLALRPVDRLAIVTYSTTATRALPLRQISSQGKRAALQVIDRIFYLGEAEPAEGLRKGLKILEDRTHHNPLAHILHLSDSPNRSYRCRDLQFPIPIHRFHIDFGFRMSGGLVMHEFEEFLAWLLGGAIRETQLRVGAEGGWILLGDLRGGEEKRIPLDLVDDCGFLSVSYSYIEGGGEHRLSTGEVVVAAEKNDQNDGRRSEIGGSDPGISTGSSDSIQRWGYLDPFMARRWAKHLHGCKA